MSETQTEEAKPKPAPTELMRVRLGTETSVRVIATGDLGPAEINRLIRILEVQKGVLEEDAEETTHE